MSGIAINCTGDIATKIANIALIKNRVFTVYSEDELIEKTKGLSFPCVGVVYDGIKKVPSGLPAARQGLSADITVSLLVFFRQDTRATNDPKLAMVDLLDRLRSSIITTRSPSGHYWEFQIEVPVQGKGGLLAYIQRWSTPVQLTPAVK